MMKKPALDRILDAQLHLKMSREGPLSKADERIQRAERELRRLSEIMGRNQFKTIPLTSICPDCGNTETMAVGEMLIDEKCTSCGRIVGGGYLKETSD